MNKCKYLILAVLISAAMAEQTKVEILKQLESGFIPETDYFTAGNLNNAWPKDISLEVDNHWKFTFRSKTEISITNLAVSIDGTTIGTAVNLHLSPGHPDSYILNDMEERNIIPAGYNFLGVYQKINATDFSGFTDYRYHKVLITISYQDKNAYTQASTWLMLVIAK